jgi:hypothetical protein
MWVFTSTGFVSAVRKADRPNVITVRSRDRKSLEPQVFSNWVAQQASEVD